MFLGQQERRAGQRLRSLLGADIRIASFASDTACLVRDSGPDGLRLALSDGVPLPEIFDLHIRKTQETRAVRLIWRGDDCVGVRFVPDPPAAVPIPIGLMRDLRAAHAEIASLRARLAARGDGA
ncbi:hypothetical protein ASF49_13080 [Methylobacterium sp. Leaf104]|uniref:hypothetical protein n=1 Tax=Methylobacterium TaxID=407 RepID=UPI0006FFE497|nr:MULTISPECIES: hypothetical protein [Methylobacterium]KQP30895.1 hypothetical protein ASF49_13080 [Methylobacterium sp. Leaf104]MCI9879240.1 hypothetical protein [Methylobacterium goesingense]